MDSYQALNILNELNSKPYKDRMKAIRNELKRIKSNDGYENIGIEYSLYFVAYVLAIIEAAYKEQVDKVYYFTREGEFFKQIHDLLAETKIFDFPIPKSELLEVSRMATFAPSITEVSINGMMRLWSQYPNQSLDAFFKSLNLNIKPYMIYLNKYGLEDTNKSLKEIYNHDGVRQLFQDQCFVQQVEVEIIDKRKLLLRYLKQKDIDPTIEKLFVVDIGWRGSIQDNIAMLFPDTEIVGYYMGIFRPYYAKIRNTRKLSFIVSDKNENCLWYFRHQFPIEIYTNSINGSVVGYSRMKDGFVIAERNNYHEEDIIFDPYIKKFQEGVILSVPIYGQMIHKEALLIEKIKPLAMKKLKEFMIKPNKTFTKPFFELVYNNMYGDGELKSLSTKFSVSSLLRDFISPGGLRKLAGRLEETHWPHAIFMRNYLLIPNWVYCKSEQQLYRHYSCIEPLRYCKKVKVSLKEYEKIDFKIQYKNEDFKYNETCYYYRGTITIPDGFISNYNIYISIKNHLRTVYFNTTKIISNGLSYTRGEICFEAKIPRSSRIDQGKHQIIVMNPQELTYIIFDI